jgi:C-terminal processing protease CtpA/Prc
MRRITSSALIALLLPATILSAANTPRDFGGVGIDGVPWADGRIAVKQLVTGGPAQLAGIRVGDIITHIDGKPTRGSDFRKMVDHRLRGRTGTTVQINIIRPGETKPRVFILTRRQLKIPAQP